MACQKKMALALCFGLHSQGARGAFQDAAHLRAAPGLHYDESPLRSLTDSLVGKEDKPPKPGTITCNGTSGLPLTCRDDAICCGAPEKQICCAPGFICAGNENAPVCLVESTCEGKPVVCDGFSGLLCSSDEESICCGDEGHQVLCAPGSECGGSATAPICFAADSVTCNGTSGLPLTCGPGAICCGADTFQICCAPGSICEGNEEAPVCEASATCAGSPVRCNGFSGLLCGGSGAICCGDPGFQVLCPPGFECGGTDTAPECVEV